ncbi:hypothetical protein [Microbacterium sp. SZ1]|uniref:hypothetical protein n=1 Tax=Microbacterium sp. SZ1 TaxID=1849736 RepID=UPI0015CD9256|nr:hypothetical protein [Microbacterium sp. SZ1]
MEPGLALVVMIAAASLLGLVIGLLLLYMVIRLGVAHALRSHDREVPRRVA